MTDSHPTPAPAPGNGDENAAGSPAREVPGSPLPPPRRRPRRSRWATTLIPAVSGGMLLAAAVYGLSLPSPGDAVPFHADLIRLSAHAPLQVGPYQGRDAHVATEAVELLRPNVILSRTFVLPEGTRVESAPSPWAQLLIVQCRDARDILGHWPPVCYEANGFTPGPVEDTTWRLDGRDLPGRRYAFHQEDSGGFRTDIVVANFLVLPDGRVVRDMDEVVEAGGDYRLRYFGAAQVQVLTPGSIDDEARAEVEQMFISAHADLIAAMASGVGPEGEAAAEGRGKDWREGPLDNNAEHPAGESPPSST